MPNLFKEAIPLSRRDCFAFFLKNDTAFNARMHMHETMEISLVINAAGATRIIGAHKYVVGSVDLAIIGPNVSHGLIRHMCTSNAVQEITVQVSNDFFKYDLFQKNHLANIRRMFDNLTGGIVFSTPLATTLAPAISALKNTDSFCTLLELLSIFHRLSTDKNRKFFINTLDPDNSSKHCALFKQVIAFMESNYAQNITPAEVAEKFNITVSLLGLIIKKKTGLSFTENLNDFRLNHVMDMLIESTHSVSEIAYMCGFQHMCTFNKLFKKNKKCTPKQFRYQYSKQIF